MGIISAPGRQTPMKITLRPYVPEDAARVVEIVNAAARLTTHTRRAVVDGAGNVRLARYVPLHSARVVATTADGGVIGYAYAADKEGGIVVETGGAVHPDY